MAFFFLGLLSVIVLIPLLSDTSKSPSDEVTVVVGVACSVVVPTKEVTRSQ